MCEIFEIIKISVVTQTPLTGLILRYSMLARDGLRFSAL